ncbi:MAG TPA: long-chain fatty acid--CoA ligase, partial [Sporomusaceae bacterium]|nr:long-chain fatty acid--CoA ligase [Sporomusaceae bacterium]
MLMHQLLLHGAMRQPDKTAFRWVDRNTELTYSEAVEQMERFSGALHYLGIAKRERVTIFAHNSLDYLIAMFACWRIGAIASLVPVQFADDLEYYLDDHQPSVVIYTQEQAEQVSRAAAQVRSVRHLVCMEGAQIGSESLPALLAAGFPTPIDPGNELAITHLSYTAGTSGRPKGVCLMHEPTMKAANCIAERLQLTLEDSSFGATPLSGTYQLVGNLL